MPEIDEFENVKSEVVSFVSKQLFDTYEGCVIKKATCDAIAFRAVEYMLNHTAVDRYISKSLNVVHNNAISECAAIVSSQIGMGKTLNDAYEIIVKQKKGS